MPPGDTPPMNSGNYSADLAPKANPPVEATVNTGRNNNFNLLRLLLAGLVVVSHSFELVDGNRLREPLTRIFGSVSAGELAVDGFFLLSGFLIVQSWRNGPRLLDFMFARILRIYPGFIVTALICALVVAPLGADARAYFGSFEPGRFLASVVMLRGPGIPATFEGTHYPFINNSLWTIKYEFMCYLCVAAVGLAGGLRTGRTWLWMTGLVLLVFTVRQGAQAFAPQAYVALPEVLEQLLRLLMFFLVGGCAQLLPGCLKVTLGKLTLAGAILAAGLLLQVWAELALATAGGYLLFALAFARHPLLKRLRPKSDISYGLYLYGWPVQKLILLYFPTLQPWPLVLFTLALACALGWLSWTVVEKPAMRLKNRAVASLGARKFA